MSTATICIGNSDDKLSQAEWSNYIETIYMLINRASYTIHFTGFSDPTRPWQNACWVIDVGDDAYYLKRELSLIAKDFHQDSIALILGETEFIKPVGT